MASPQKIRLKRKLVEILFWPKVQKQSTCWIWMGSMNPYGYGRIKINRKHYRAHRISFWLTKSDPKKLLVCHSCDNRRCVNPDHLWLGTSLDNQTDMMKKGRHRTGIWDRFKGEDHPNARWTDKDIREMRRLYASGISQSEIGRKYGVSQAIIYSIVRNRTWKHVQ